jgi:two-component system response regulator CpxR
MSQATPPRLLVIDDDQELCALMCDYFTQQGFALDAEHDGGRGLSRAVDGGYDLVILDVMLPGLEGLSVLHQLRQRSAVPVIMLTARTALMDRIAGFDAGADDYLPKPFGPSELIARIRAVLRRSTGRGSVVDPINLNGIHIDSRSRTVTVDDIAIDLTSVEFAILEHLARAAGRIVSRDELTLLLGREGHPFDRAVDVHVHHLRRKIGSDRPVIRTVRGEGYLFCR